MAIKKAASKAKEAAKEALGMETEEETVEEEPKAPRVNRDFNREDLNDLRDAVNELHARG